MELTHRHACPAKTSKSSFTSAALSASSIHHHWPRHTKLLCVAVTGCNWLHLEINHMRLLHLYPHFVNGISQNSLLTNVICSASLPLPAVCVKANWS